MNSDFFKMRKLLLIIAIALAVSSVCFFLKPANVDAGLAKTKFLGNIIASSVPSNFATYWNQVTPENGGKWGSVQSSPGSSYNWSACDTAYNYARSNGMPFKFHCLVWGSQQPSGVNSASQVQTWIQAAGARYGGAQFVDVVNEPLHAQPSYANVIGGSGSTGWDWIVWSFQQARAAFPNSKLLINEYGIISDPSAASRYVSIINILKSRGLVDGIGIQCHQFNMDTVSTSTMRSVLDTLAATGLPIYVSELDMTGDDQTQLARYREKFPVLWEHPSVQGITLWGYIQGQTWKDQTWLITSSGAERPALQWLRQYFSANGTPTPVVNRTPTPYTNPTPTPYNNSTPTPYNNPTPTPGSGGGYVVTYTMNDWGSGATVNITIRNNTATAVNGWTLAWTFPGNQKVTNMWNASYSQNGASVSAKNLSYNDIIPANGGSQSFGFNLSYSGSNARPASFTLNGTACQVQ
jgi:endo-1,4-beta-xylanase